MRLGWVAKQSTAWRVPDASVDLHSTKVHDDATEAAHCYQVATHGLPLSSLKVGR